MAADINKLFSALQKAEEQILGVIDSLNAISKDAIAYNGDISRVVPQQLKVTIDTLLQVVQGQQQSSLESLTNFLDSIPISQLRKSSLVKTTINQEGVDQTNSSINNATAAIDTTPNTSGGAQSAIAEGTVDLRKYYNEHYNGKKDLKKIRENNELSFDAILDDSDLGTEYEDLVNGGDAAHLDFAETPIDGYAEQFGLGIDDEPLEDDMMFDDAGDGVETFDADWRDLPSAHESDDFESILNDGRNPVELGA